MGVERRTTRSSKNRRAAFRLRSGRGRLLLSVIRASLAGISRLSPELSACCAELLFRTPPRQKRTRRESAILATGASEAIRGEAGPIATWKWGEGPVVLLVHGWGGHAGRLSRFVDPLTEAGVSVVAFDLPGHGASAGHLVSLPEMARAIEAVSEHVGPATGLVAHSLGATASALAMRRSLRIKRSVFLAPPADFEHYSHRFGRILHIARPITESMKKRLTERYCVQWSEFRIVDWAHSMSSSLLVFHDRGDFKVPLRDGEAIVRAWPGGVLVTTRGLGHHKILRDLRVIRQGVEFLGRGQSPARPQQPPQIPERAATIG
jgi:pimeloyl-ACP methyl ester carboxylesterase